MRGISASVLLVLAGCAVRAASGCSSEGIVGAFGRKSDAGADGADTGQAADGGAPSGATSPVGAGGSSTCVRTSSGDARCWGDNQNGELGIGDVDPSQSAAPVTPVSLDSVTAIASGESAHCALRTGGHLSCWGLLPVAFNTQPLMLLPVTNPLDIGDIGPVARVAVGHDFTCALELAGSLRCWGLNSAGQLGLGSLDPQADPTTVNGFDGAITSIAASMGGLFACATTDPGSVYCWGRNDLGAAFGTADHQERPTKVDGLGGGHAVEVVAGAKHACARFDGGSILCWGANDNGQLGDGTVNAHTTPVAPKFLSDVVALSAGGDHACALRSEGSVLCWGGNDQGQAGGGPNPTPPSAVSDPSFGARAVSCGLSHTCLWADGGKVRCFGANDSDQLGPKEATF